MRRSITQTAIRILYGIALWALALPAFAVPERVIDLEGTANTRDIGGYPTTDGRVVEYGGTFDLVVNAPVRGLYQRGRRAWVRLARRRSGLDPDTPVAPSPSGD